MTPAENTPVRLRFDFTEIEGVKSNVPLSGRGIRFVCQQFDGSLCYTVTEAARKRLQARHGYSYTNDTNDVSLHAPQTA